MMNPLRSFVALVSLLSAGCSSVSLEDCPSGVLGNNEPDSARLRTSHYRVMLKDRDAAARRFVAYALMSALAYRESPGCARFADHDQMTDKRSQTLAERLRGSLDGTAWTERDDLSLKDRLSAITGCEDDIGLMLRVFQRRVDGRTQVAIAFRGTTGWDDWLYGNFWWITRFVLPDNQLSRARDKSRQIIDQITSEATAKGELRPRFVTTGHSLGGGLAQHVLYSFPNVVEQAIAFDPSSVTGFVSVGSENQQAGCSCSTPELASAGVDLGAEARIIRIYQTYEVLANLRFFHKVLLSPERHVQEVRFPFDAPHDPVQRHNMQTLADNLHAAASRAGGSDSSSTSWLASRDASCTAKLIDAQVASCAKKSNAGLRDSCPQ